MPTRLIREGILTSDSVNSLSPQDEVFYRRLMSIVDDYGRYDARPAILRAQLFSLQLDRIRESDVVRGLAACEKASLIRCYEVEGKQYLQLEKFGQQVRAKSSKWPDPPADDNGCKQMRADAHLDEDVCEDEDEGACDRGGNLSDALVFPLGSDCLDTPEFRAQWDEWLAYRTEKRYGKLATRTVQSVFLKLAKVGHDRAIATIQQSIANDWKGLFPEKVGKMADDPNADPGGAPIKTGWRE